jgi:CMP-N-acetylneuraminic acid synthetase neuA
MKVAVIPARSGSVELAHKNLSVVGGKSLLNRAIDFAVEADAFDKIIVTTDYCKHLFYREGIEVRNRPESLATSHATMVEVLEDVIETFGLAAEDKIVLLQPTSPFRVFEDLVKVLGLMGEYDSVITVKELEYNPALFVTPISNTGLELKQVDACQTNRQEQPKHYYPNGNLFGVTVGTFCETKSFYGGKLGYVLQKGKCNIDINHKDDLLFAQFMEQQ